MRAIPIGYDPNQKLLYCGHGFSPSHDPWRRLKSCLPKVDTILNENNSHCEYAVGDPNDKTNITRMH